jgi:hypothetical protein
MDLDVTLGSWLPVHRNTWYAAYMTKDSLFWRKEGESSLSVMKKTAVPGFYHFSHMAHTVPLDSHPIRFQKSGDELWTQGPINMRVQPDTDPPPGHEILNTVVPGLLDTVTISSDGLTHLYHAVASCAWILHQSADKEIKACFLIRGMASLFSYRSELEGVYRALIQLQRSGLQPGVTSQWCDNKTAVDKSSTEIYAPGICYSLTQTSSWQSNTRDHN